MIIIIDNTSSMGRIRVYTSRIEQYISKSGVGKCDIQYTLLFLHVVLLACL